MAVQIGGGDWRDQKMFIPSIREGYLFIPSICEGKEEKFSSLLSTLFSNKLDSNKIPSDYSLKRKANQEYTSLIGKSFSGNPVQAKNLLAHNPPVDKHVCIRNDTHVNDIMMWTPFN